MSPKSDYLTAYKPYYIINKPCNKCIFLIHSMPCNIYYELRQREPKVRIINKLFFYSGIFHFRNALTSYQIYTSINCFGRLTRFINRVKCSFCHYNALVIFQIFFYACFRFTQLMEQVARQLVVYWTRLNKT